MHDQVIVLDEGRELAFAFDEVVRYNGGRSPAGVALAFQALACGLPVPGGGVLIERRCVEVASAFPGPGVRDAFELVLRAVTGDRYRLDPSLARGANRFVFRLEGCGRGVTLALRDGFVPDEFYGLLALQERTAAQERRFGELKVTIAEMVLTAVADAVFEVCPSR